MWTNQIVKDIFELEKVGVDHIYLVFDFSSHYMNLEKNLDYAIKILNSFLSLIIASCIYVFIIKKYYFINFAKLSFQLNYNLIQHIIKIMRFMTLL
jgi:hypothetical protein